MSYQKKQPRSRAVERSVFLLLICILAGMVALLVSRLIPGSSSSAAGAGQVVTDMLRDIGILLISVGLISVVYELLIRQQLVEDMTGIIHAELSPDTRRLGITALYRSRDDRIHRGQSIDGLIGSTRQQMLCVGLGLLAFVPERQALIRSRIRQGCHFRFMIFDADSTAATVLDASLGAGNGDLVKFIRAQAGFISSFRAELAKDGLVGQFEVKVYDVVPTFGLIEIDPGEPTHQMFVELYSYRAEGALSPNLALNDAPGGLGHFFRERAELLWNAAHPLP